MGRQRRKRMRDGKRNITTGLIQEYDIKTAADMEEALKNLLGDTIQEVTEGELDEHIVKKIAVYIILGINAGGRKMSKNLSIQSKNTADLVIYFHYVTIIT